MRVLKIVKNIDSTSQIITDKVQSLDLTQFQKIKESEFRSSYKLTGLKYLRDKAGHERNLRELYRGRAPYELLQNADDAGAKKVAYILCSDGLVFVHDGRWFTIDNFRSLADGWSDKDPEQCIGHKGLGFRSVLDITPSPYICKIENKQFFAVKFTWALNNGHIQKAFQRDPTLRSHYAKWTKHGQLACPVMAIPGIAKKHNLGASSIILDKLISGKYGSKFTTMFWFPARDPDIDPGVLEELSPTPIISDSSGPKTLLEFLEIEVSILLPFLNSVETVYVYKNDNRIGITHIPKGSEKAKEGEIIVYTNISGHSQSKSFYQKRFIFPIPDEIFHQPDTPKAVKKMKEAKIVLSARLEDGQPYSDDDSCFHVYFPTEERTGVGFVIHGDFFVKPDRTRLMGGNYNEWLLGCAANGAANEFLSQLLGRYRANHVFSALSPVGAMITDSAETFVSSFEKRLQERTEPFVPAKAGLRKREDVVLPPKIDERGFWDAHFADVVDSVLNRKRVFLEPAEDGRGTRAFLRLAKVQELEPQILLSFIEATGHQERSPDWWYDCYSYMASDDNLSRHDHSFFSGHKLIPATDLSVVEVPKDSNLIVCLPPAGEILSLQVPDCLSDVFVFVNSQVANFLEKGTDTVRSWVLDRFRISRFEASDLLPRAIRGVVTHIFNGELAIKLDEIKKAWLFMKEITRVSRTILSSAFWREIGRFPLPSGTMPGNDSVSPDKLIPAFLAYFPASFIDERSCLLGIEGLRRADESFLTELIEQSGKSQTEWIEFFKNIGVSSNPKLLKYARILPAGKDLHFTPDGPNKFEAGRFSGERQSDENRALVQTLREENLWEKAIENADLCDHHTPKVIRSFTLLEGLNKCAHVAENEFQKSDNNWQQRLWSLIRGVSLYSINELDDDEVFCRGGSAGGHSISIGSYVRSQIDCHPWLPSSQGPASSSECFLRLSSRRLVSMGSAHEELGDKLLPYVVVDNLSDLTILQELGVEVLDDAPSASPTALVRALYLLGERLSTEWGQREIIRVRSRWRLVRGAIQEIYRTLNQIENEYGFSPNAKFATRSADVVELHTCPLYYAEPGSPIEMAFKGTLHLFDADRVYPSLFKRIGVSRLISGQIVNEKFLAEKASVNATRLKDEIVNNLAPYLLAPIIAKSEKPTETESIVRRIRERFEVKVTRKLTVSFSLTEDPSIERVIDFPKFYLQRRIIRGRGAIQEGHYILYVAGNSPDTISLSDLDADALGEALAPIFLIGMSEELTTLFPRISSRFQHLQARKEGMQEFMHCQLGISIEAQDMAWAMVTGEDIKLRPITTPPPPPAKIISSSRLNDTKTDGAAKHIAEQLDQHSQELSDSLHKFVQDLANGSRKEEKSKDSTSKIYSPKKSEMVTDEQEARGKKGEEEIKRRLNLPGGWEGFIFIADKRDPGCGYDFLCAMGEQEVKLEIKTFIINGRIVMTSLELREAAASQGDYFLVGVLDNEKPEYEWPCFIIRNPIDILLTKGEFDIQAKLQALAEDVFNLSQDNET